ncbi:MAG: hypothetical protein AAF602_25785 [Myxococcota bacterium]
MWWMLTAALAAPGEPSTVPPKTILGPDVAVTDDAPVDEAKLLATVRELDPVQHQRLLRLKRRDPVAYRTVLRRVARKMERASRDPDSLARALEIRRINQALLALRDQYRAASGDRRVAIRAEMVTKALGLMELKQAERRARLREMQDRLDKLQAEVDEREATKDRLVDEYVDGLLKP